MSLAAASLKHLHLTYLSWANYKTRLILSNHLMDGHLMDGRLLDGHPMDGHLFFPLNCLFLSSLLTRCSTPLFGGAIKAENSRVTFTESYHSPDSSVDFDENGEAVPPPPPTNEQLQKPTFTSPNSRGFEMTPIKSSRKKKGKVSEVGHVEQESKSHSRIIIETHQN